MSTSAKRFWRRARSTSSNSSKLPPLFGSGARTAHQDPGYASPSGRELIVVVVFDGTLIVTVAAPKADMHCRKNAS